MKNSIQKTIAHFLPFLIGTKAKQRFTVLTYHRVLKDFDPMRSLEPVEHEFNWQMELISRYFTPLPLSEALSLMGTGSLPERTVCVTFDDGYANNEEVALPILKRWNIPATVFVTTGLLNGGMMWNDKICESVRSFKGETLDLRHLGLGIHTFQNITDRRKTAVAMITEIKHWSYKDRSDVVRELESLVHELPLDMMMTDKQVKHLSDNGVEIGAHTESHPILSRLTMAEAREEIINSRQYLERLLGKPVRYFAYPNGRFGEDYLQEHRDFVEKAGFDAAFSTHWGAVATMSDKWQLPRFTPWDNTPLRFQTRLLLNYRNPL